MSQTSYTVDAPVAFPGMLGEGGKQFSISRASENAADIGAGQAAVAGSDPATQFELPSTTGEVFLGIVSAKHARQKLDTAGAASFVQNENLELIRQGRIWVNTEIAVAAGDPVFFRHTDNGPLVVGADAWRADLDTNNADAIAGASYLVGNASPGLALIEINHP